MQKWFTIGVLLLANHVFAQLTYQQLYVDYDSAVTYKNLRLVPIRYKGNNGNTRIPLVQNAISFDQALKQGLVTVQERGTTAIENVHWLSLYNNSDKNIFVSSGEVLAGGRQDRVVTKDTMVIAKSGRIDLPVMCVEEGRWSEKDKKFAYKKMANTHLRKIIDETRSQVQIWKEINSQLERDKIKNKTLAYLSRDKDKTFIQLQNEYWPFFEKKLGQPDSNIVGMVCMSGDKILGSDIFISSNLFYGKLQALMQGYIEEAIIFGSLPTVTDDRTRKYLDQFLQDEASQEEFVKKNGKLFKAGGKVIHITTY
ncbi:MAG: hypothetical protein NVSMB7_10430 [Chitinophagaceae bacterium]